MGGGKGGGKRRVIDYHIDMHWGVCWGPVDQITDVRFKEKSIEISPSANGENSVDLPQLFGGDEVEGGVRGTVYSLLGESTQLLSDTLASYLLADGAATAADVPGFRGICSLFFYGEVEYDGTDRSGRGWMISQNNPYVPDLDVSVKRISRHPNLPDAYAEPVVGSLTGQANPIHMIFEIYTNSDWGLGWPVAAFNLATWTTVCEDIFDEGLGLSMMWVQPMEIEAFVAEILDHIQATVYSDPRTGLIEIKLLRAGETPTKTFDSSNSILRDMERRALEDTINEIIVTFTDPESEEDSTVTVQDLANIAAQNGQIKSDGRNYYGVRDADLAWQLAERDLREASYPLFSCKIVTDRTQSDVVPGEVVELVWPEEGITSMNVRVLDINRGKKGQGNVILSVVEDIWSLDQAEFETPPTTAWTLPPATVQDFSQTSAVTAPYPVLSRLGLSPSYADVYVGVLAHNGDDTEMFTLTTEIVNTAGDTVEVDYTGMLMTPFGALSTALDAEAETIFSDAEMWTMLGDFNGFAVGQLFYIGDSTDDALNEIVMLKSYSAGNWTIKRGLYDTVPRDWVVSTELWFLDPDGFAAADPNVRPAGAEISYWPRPVIAGTTLTKLAATELAYTPSERPHLPFRPANISVDGDNGFGAVDIGAKPSGFTVAWSNRNRNLEDTVALYWDEADATPEAGQTTTIQFLDASDDSMIVQYTGLTGASFVVPSNGGSATAWATKMRVFSVRDGLESLQYFERLVDVEIDFAATDGYGANYGESYGTGA